MTHPDIETIERTGLTPTQLAHINDTEAERNCECCDMPHLGLEECEACGRAGCKNCVDYYEHWDVHLCTGCKDDVKVIEAEMPGTFEVAIGKDHKVYSHSGKREAEGRTVFEYSCCDLPPIELSIDVWGWVQAKTEERQEAAKEYRKNKKPL